MVFSLRGAKNLLGGGQLPPLPSPNLRHCVKGVEWGLGTRGLRILAAFWPGILVEVIQEASVVQRL